MKVVLFWLFHWWREEGILLQKRKVKLAFHSSLLSVLLCLTPAVSAESTLEKTLTVSADAPYQKDTNGIKGTFTVFPGMEISPAIHNGSLLAFDFYNETALWYGLSERKKFRDPSSICKSFLSPSLIMPQANWINLGSFFDFQARGDRTNFERTMMPIANVDCNLTTSEKCPDYCGDSSESRAEKAELTIFYNNPYAWIDTPSVMNVLTLASLAVEALGIDQKTTTSLTGELTDARETAKVLHNNYQDKLDTTIAILGSVNDLITITMLLCDLESINDPSSNLSVTQCDNFFSNLKTPIEKFATALLTALQALEKYKGSSGRSTTPVGEIKAAIELLSQKDALKKSKASILRKISSISLKGVTDELTTIMIQKMLVNRVYPTQTETDNYNIAKELRVYLGGKKLTPGIKKFHSDFLFKIITGGDTSYAETLSGFASFATFFHNILNLRESILKADGKKIFADFFGTITPPLISIVKEKAGEEGVKIFEKALANNIGIVKAWKLASTAGKGSKIAWDYVTKPDIIHIDVKRTDHVVTTTSTTSNIPDSPLTSDGAVVYKSQGYDIVKKDTKVNFTFTHLAPQLKVVRYIKVKTLEEIRTRDLSVDPSAPNISTVEDIPYPTHLISYTLPYVEGREITVLPPGVTTTTSYQYYPIDSIGYFLVGSGFEASVEAHGIFRPDEEKTIKQILDDGKIALLWHTHKYEDNSITTPPPSFEDRFNFTDDIKKPSCKSSFKNCIIQRLDSNWFSSPFDDFPKSVNEGGLLSSYLADNKKDLGEDHYLINDEKIRYLDFSKAYTMMNNSGNLKHQTPGIYSNFAGILIGDKEPNNSDQFHNTFNVYVLNDYSSKDKSHFKDDFLKSSCVWSGSAGNYLNIATEVLSPYYVAVKSGGAWIDIKENGIPHQRVELNKSLDGTIYVYDYILRAWENTVLKGEPEKFQSLLEPPLGQPSKLGNHIISFKLSELSGVNNRCPFSDVPVNQWYTKPIIELQKLGIIKGYEDGSFGLNNPVNRAEFLKMAMLAADSSKKDSDFPQTETSFSDVPKSHWASGYINNAKSKHIIDGFKDGKFKPDSGVDRVAAAKMVAIAFNFMPIRTLSQMFQDATNALLGEKTILWCPPYKDIINNQWYCPYITKLKEIQVMTGYDDGSFKPANKMTRAETATAICRAYSYKKQYNTALCD